MLAKATIVRVLLASGDIQVIDTLCHLMEKMAMHVEVCSDVSSAARKLCHAKFEALVVDLKNPAEGLELIKKPRTMTSHKGAVVVAILNNNQEMPSAFRAGASFALARPLVPAKVMRTLKASYPMMVREKRRSYRCPLKVDVKMSSSRRAEFVATSVNISEGGMALSSSVPLQVGERITLKLILPDIERTIRVNAEVCWNNMAGRLGLEFVHVPQSTLEDLRSWIAVRLEEYPPR